MPRVSIEGDDYDGYSMNIEGESWFFATDRHIHISKLEAFYHRLIKKLYVDSQSRLGYLQSVQDRQSYEVYNEPTI